MKEKDILNSVQFRKKLLKEIKDKKIKMGNCDNNLGVPSFRMLQIPSDDNPTMNGVALLCLDRNCIRKSIMKIMPIDTNLGLKTLKTNPAIVETELLRLFTNELIKKNRTPNIVAYYGSYECSNMTGLFQRFPYLNSLLVKNKIRPNVKVMIAEYVNGGELSKFIDKLHESKAPDNIKNKIFKSIIFQIIYTLAILQKKYKFAHNDLHLRNILIDTDMKGGGYWSYNYKNDKFYIPNHGLMPKIWDLDFATIFKRRNLLKSRIKNSKIVGYIDQWGRKQNWKAYGIEDKFNPKYDIHMFLNGLWMTRESLTPEITQFIEKTIPKKYLGFNNDFVNLGRINKDYSDIPDPETILMNTDYFNNYKIKVPNKDILSPKFKF